MSFFRRDTTNEEAVETPVVETPSTTESTGSITFTAAELSKLITEAIAAGVREFKKPTPEEQVKLDADRLRKQREQQARVDVGKAEEQRRTSEQERCNHRRQDGSPRINGQLHSDGKVHLFCLFCCKEVRVYTPDSYEFAQRIGV